MARPKSSKTRTNQPKSRPAYTPEARENQLISLAYDLAEERLRNGTATSQEVVHFLRLGSVKERKELALMDRELELKVAKTEALQSAKRMEELYVNAINAMKSYSGVNSNGEYDEEDIY